MQIKHTFLFTLILGLVWTGFLFAYALGPDPAMNGIFGTAQTCAMAGCHVGNPTNAAGGTLTITGLPAEWTPGQTYALSITIARTGAQLFGFQLSAVSDTTNQQAGSLAPGHARVQILCGRATPAQSTQVVPCSTAGAIQYAEHSNAQIRTSTYLVNWTAPASASVGAVRFNLAGNAANGDSNNTGDFIYTRTDKVSPASAGPDLSVRPFTMVDRGGVSLITDGAGGLSVGYARIQPNAGSTTPAGVAIFGLKQSNILVTEAGVPAAKRLLSGRIYAEVNVSPNTGFAIANPNDSTATIKFHFTNANGVDTPEGTITLGPNQQLARFLDQAPFNGALGFQGTFSFTSDKEVSVIALRGFYNERTPSEFLTTTLPVTDLSATPESGTVYLPHFAEGGGWRTQIVLVNPTDTTLTGAIQFFDPGSASAGAPQSITANGQTASSFSYSIPRQSSFKLVTAGTAAPPKVGSVRVTPDGAAVAPSALVIFSFKPAAITVSEAGAPGIKGAAFRMYAEETATGGVGAIQTGLAVANLSATAAKVTLALTQLDGAASLSTVIDVPANGQRAGFLHDFFPSLTLPFRGVMRITGDQPEGLSVVGLRGRYNERSPSDFLITTTPPTNEATPPSTAEFLFPHFVNGGGYTTQFILFSGSTGQASEGNLKFYSFDGTPLNLTVN